MKIDGLRFQLRAAAIIRSPLGVLVHRLEGDDFWSLPGGRVEPDETAEAALVREFEEEVCEPLDCGPLALVAENFFEYDGERYHEIGLYFRATLRPDSPLLTSPGPHVGAEPTRTLLFQWFAEEDFSIIDLRPTFLVQELSVRDAGVRHIVHRDRPER